MTRLERMQQSDYYEDFQTYAETFLLECKIRNLTPATIDTYTERLHYLFQYLSNRSLKLPETSTATIKEYILSQIDNIAAESINGRLRVWRVFFNLMIEDGLLDSNPMTKIKLLKTERKIKQVLSLEDISKVLRSLDKRNWYGARHYSMILLFWDGMLRRGELIALKRTDINFKDGYVIVNGKGRKQRIVPLSPQTIKSLHTFINHHLKNVRTEYVFCYRDGLPLKDRHCFQLLDRVGRMAGVIVRPHLIRHSAATWFVTNGGSPAILQKILGHSSLVVTDRYLHVSDDMLLKQFHGVPMSAII